MIQNLQTLISVIIASGYISPTIGMCFISLLPAIISLFNAIKKILGGRQSLKKNVMLIYPYYYQGDIARPNVVYVAISNVIMQKFKTNMVLTNDRTMDTYYPGRIIRQTVMSIIKMPNVVYEYNGDTYNLSINNEAYMYDTNKIVSTIKIETNAEQEKIKKFFQHIQSVYDDSAKSDDDLKIYYWKEENWAYNFLRTKKTRDNLFLDEKIFSKLINAIDKFTNNSDLYKEAGIPYKIGFLLYGPPGNGKTSTINFLANYTNRMIYKIDLQNYKNKNSLMSSVCLIPSNSLVVIEDIDTFSVVNKRLCYRLDMTMEKIDENKKLFKQLFDTVNIDSKEGNYLEIFNNNIEKIIKFMNNDSTNTFYEIYKNIIKDTQKTNFISYSITMADILNIFDGNEYLYDCIICFTSNHIDNIDPAIIRPGRIDIRIEYGWCTPEIIKNIFKYFYKKDIDIDMLNNIKISQAELINSIILPNLYDINSAIEKLLEHCII